MSFHPNGDALVAGLVTSARPPKLGASTGNGKTRWLSCGHPVGPAELVTGGGVHPDLPPVLTVELVDSQLPRQPQGALLGLLVDQPRGDRVLRDAAVTEQPLAAGALGERRRCANEPVGFKPRARPRPAARPATSLIFGAAPLARFPALATALLATRSTVPSEVTATLSIAVETSSELTRCCR